MDSKNPLTNNLLEEITIQPPLSSPIPAVSINKQSSQFTPTTAEITKADVPETVKETLYGKMYQNFATNQLSKIRSGTEHIIPPKQKEGEEAGFYIIPKGEKFRVGWKSLIDALNFKPSTQLLFDILTEELTKAGGKSPDVTLSLDDYCFKRGLSDKKEARKRVTEDLRALYGASLTFKDKVKGAEEDFADVRLCESKAIRNGVIYFGFSRKLFDLLRGSPPMAYAQELYRIDTRKNPNTLPLWKTILAHKRMNLGKSNENIISVQSLLESAPFLPAYREVMAGGNRSPRDRIINPFERDMNGLSKTATWKYCYKKGPPLTEEEQKNLNLETFIRLMIEVTWNEYPGEIKEIEPAKAKENTQ